MKAPHDNRCTRRSHTFWKRFFFAASCLACFAIPAFAATMGDDFNDNHVDPAKWGPDEKFGHGVLTEKNQWLEYTCTGGTADDDLIRRWRAGNGPYTSDWEMQMDVFNNTSFTTGSVNQNNSYGIKLRGPTDDDQEIFVELYNSQLSGPPSRKGFDADFETPGLPDVFADAGVPANNLAAVRMAFNSATKVVTVYYDNNPSDGYQWVEFGSFGVGALPLGMDGNANWGLTDADQFRIYIYGYSTFMTVASGQMYGDNFQAAGLVGPARPFTISPLLRSRRRNSSLSRHASRQ